MCQQQKGHLAYESQHRYIILQVTVVFTIYWSLPPLQGMLSITVKLETETMVPSAYSIKAEHTTFTQMAAKLYSHSPESFWGDHTFFYLKLNITAYFLSLKTFSDYWCDTTQEEITLIKHIIYFFTDGDKLLLHDFLPDPKPIHKALLLLLDV